TVGDIELLDPDLSSERLAYRLFHERGVRVFRATAVAAQCSCSRHGVENMLRSFSPQDRSDMVEDGRITVTCEFCSSTYVFAPTEIAAARPPRAQWPIFPPPGIGAAPLRKNINDKQFFPFLLAQLNRRCRGRAGRPPR